MPAAVRPYRPIQRRQHEHHDENLPVARLPVLTKVDGVGRVYGRCDGLLTLPTVVRHEDGCNGDIQTGEKLRQPLRQQLLLVSYIDPHSSRERHGQLLSRVCWL